MGGSVSRPEIVLDHEEGQHELRPLPTGSLLQGKVVVKLSKKVMIGGGGASSDKSSRPPALELRLYGKEKVCMNRSKSSQVVTRGTTTTNTKRSAMLTRAPKHAERALLDVRMQWPQFPLLQQDNGKSLLAEGTYVFPFQVQLPASLPSSTYYPTDDQRHRSKMRFRIQYKLSASIDMSAALLQQRHSGNSHSKNLQSAVHYLWIVASAPDPPLPVTPCILEPIAREIQAPYSGGSIFHSGSKAAGYFWCGAAVENCHLQSGDRVHVHVACRNDSTVPIRHVQIQILERCTWGTTAAAVPPQEPQQPPQQSALMIDPTTGRVRSRTTLQQRDERVLVALNHVQIPGLAAKEKPGVLKSVFNALWGGDGGDNNNPPNSAHQRQLLQQVFDDIMTDHSLIPDIQLPPDVPVRESYAGQLIQIQHLVRIEFPTMGGGRGANKLPILELPLHIAGHATPLDQRHPFHRSGAGTAYRIPTESATTGLEQGVAYEKEATTTGTSSTKGGSPATITTQHPNDIPVADAVEIPNDDDNSAVVAADVVLVLGGDAMLRQQARRRSNSQRQQQQPRGLMELVPLPPPPSLPTLLREMNASIDEFEWISQKLLEEPWMRFFQQLNSEDFGRIVAAIHHNPLDQSRVALVLAPHLHQGRGMQCVDAAAAVRNALPQHRAVLAQRLLPVCTDAPRNQQVVRAVLTDWEQTVIASPVLESVRSSSSSRKSLAQ